MKTKIRMEFEDTKKIKPNFYLTMQFEEYKDVDECRKAFKEIIKTRYKQTLREWQAT